MIIITLKEQLNNIEIKVHGHSDSIVCAGVSALLEAWRLTEEHLEQHKIPAEKGFVQAEIPKTHISHILFIQLTIGLKALHEQYPKEITLNIGG